MKIRREHILLAFILLGALAIRLYPVFANLPYLYWHDENNYIESAMRYGSLDFKQLNFSHGGLYQSILFVQYGIYYLAAKISGLVNSPIDFYIGYLKDPTPLFLVARISSALWGMGIVFLSYLISAIVYNRRAAIATSLFAAFSLLMVQMSSLALADMPSVFIMLLSFLLILRSSKDPDENILFYTAAALIGLAVACKYYVAFGATVLWVAAFIKSRGSKTHYMRRLLSLIGFGSILICVGFLAGIPSSVLNPYGFFKDTFIRMGGEYILRNPHNNTWLFYFTNHFRNGLGIPLEIVALCGVACAVYRHSKEDVLLLSLPVAYYLLFMHSMGFAYHLLPVVPFIFVLAGGFLDNISCRIFKRAPLVSVLCLGIIILTPTFIDSVKYVKILASPDTRSRAKSWIDESIPEGARILSEGYSSGIAIHAPAIADNEQTLKRDLDQAVSSGGRGYSVKTKIANFHKINGGNKVYDVYKTTDMEADDIDRIDPAYIIMTSDNDHFSGRELDYYFPEEGRIKRDRLKKGMSQRYQLVKSFEPSDRFTWWFPHLVDHDYSVIRSVTTSSLKSYVRGPKIDVYRKK